jgi:hypothetical protein
VAPKGRETAKKLSRGWRQARFDECSAILIWGLFDYRHDQVPSAIDVDYHDCGDKQ